MQELGKNPDLRALCVVVGHHTTVHSTFRKETLANKGCSQWMRKEH